MLKDARMLQICIQYWWNQTLLLKSLWFCWTEKYNFYSFKFFLTPFIFDQRFWCVCQILIVFKGSQKCLDAHTVNSSAFLLIQLTVCTGCTASLYEFKSVSLLWNVIIKSYIKHGACLVFFGFLKVLNKSSCVLHCLKNAIWRF